jgi:uncharacterized protein with PIN domain
MANFINVSPCPERTLFYRREEMAICPYCQKNVTLTDSENKVTKETTGFIKKEVMYSCPHCNKVLGFAFFLGGLITGRP